MRYADIQVNSGEWLTFVRVFNIVLFCSDGKLGSEIIPVSLNEHTTLYRPPHAHAPEFEVERTCIAAGGDVVLQDREVASILLIVSGECSMEVANGNIFKEISTELHDKLKNLTGGTVVYVGANYSIRVTATQRVEIFRSHINLHQ